jgi:hypothetical protein
MTRGDLVHIPQDAFLIREVNDITGKNGGDYVKVKRPVKALFWEKDIKDPKWCSVYYKDTIWTVRLKDIYPITQEIENAS